ncbi:Cyclic di-GMP phosphodiesterase response regulator RpfG [Calidithermus terrae]|uniref:Cyclic di-GMP phosphodiesterase response regulator RpfG n=1 Tax=Calidithermus terrae TaxID=1408545 RepID=A0A399ET99_9DEIN|nr:HD-GYP domain-containing protein [Calidithermus terrae]RIH87834.1 Cyclic di-GMP phosphodiesterase response regulator RpfG [Calidithermus terrae]
MVHSTGSDATQVKPQAWLQLVWEPTGLYRLAHLAVVALSLLAVVYVVSVTGGTPNPFVHLMYGPILLAAAGSGAGVATAVGLLAGVLMGPYQQASLAAAGGQPDGGWLVRALIYCAVGGGAGLVFERLRRSLRATRELAERLARGYGNTLRTLAAIVAERDEQTGGHCERVAYHAHELGKRLGVEGHDLETLWWAGLLHDLGKVGIPEYILRKPGKLTAEEYREVQRHADLGAQILLSASPEFATIAEGVRAHHERWDGKGYPRGLAGEAIPLFGRILAVADVFEVLTSRRPYREPSSVPEALAELQRNAGSQFDPQVVEALLQLVQEGRVQTEGVPPPLYHEVPVFEVRSMGLESQRAN